ncbi:MAG: TMEM175 family protein [Thermoplasmata archaeon]
MTPEDSAPVKVNELEGLDETGSDMSRTLSLSDGIFAFSMTLLVINLSIPVIGSSTTSGGLYHYLAVFYANIVAYGVAFWVIGSWWRLHHRLFSAIVRYDRTLTSLNLAFLLTISITAFPTALVFEYGPNHFFVFGSSANLAVIIFSGVQTIAGLLLWGIWRYASGPGGLVRPSLTPEWRRVTSGAEFNRAVVFAASMALGVISPYLAEATWVLSSFIRHRKRVYLRPLPHTSGAVPQKPPPS